MSEHSAPPSVPRRSFLSKVTAGAAAFGIAGRATPVARAQSGPFQPAKHTQDDWMDQLPGKHRLALDTTSPAGADSVRRFVDNFMAGNKSGYGLEPADLGVIIVLRHFATPFAFNDAMWGKYGAAISDEIKFTDPKTNQAPTTNVYKAADISLDSLVSRGVHFAVCGMATRYFAGVVSGKGGGSADAIYQELVTNMIGNTHTVAAGIVAVNRAQERGYTFAFIG
jgi:intracellular sulfur oxidation DsrE/DsrF family protein